jgi:hypothetical protein
MVSQTKNPLLIDVIELMIGGEGGIRPPSRLPPSRFTLLRTSRRYGGSHRVSAPSTIARSEFTSERRWLAERVGFVHLRATRYGGSHRVSAPSTIARSEFTSERRWMAERVGFEPTCPCGQDAFEAPPLRPLRYLSVVTHLDLHSPIGNHRLSTASPRTEQRDRRSDLAAGPHTRERRSSKNA